ncbi:MAG: autotransporter domain-containing protein, partial [Alphaproteobacteria bacterium]
GGAVYTDSTIDGEQNPLAITEISDTKFVNNKAAWGGAVENGGQTDMTNVTFTGNRAEYRTDDGGYGGAVYNGYHSAGQLTITNGIFTDNSASGDGGAISNHGTMNLKGQNVFEGNRGGSNLNDIDNQGKLNIAGDITLDGGISGYRGLSNYGTVVFADGSSLTVKAGTTTISKNNVKNNGTTIHFNIGNGFAGDYALITENSTLDNEFTIADNNLYNITATDTKGTYTISKKSSSEVAESLDVSSNDAAAITAITDGESQNGLFNKISDYVNDLIQSGNAGNIKTAVAATRALAPEVAPMVQQTQSETANQIYNAVGKRLSGGTSGASQGIASGDVMKDISVWFQGLANHAKLDRTAKFAGFKADTYGVALGAEKKLDTDIKAGVGYAYSKTDIDAKGRDTDVKTHTLLAYGEYKPSAWFVNGIISYGWSDYDEDKKVAGNRVNAEYEIKTFGLQAMTGYDLYTQYATVTPEAGLRYLRINGGHYTDEAGQTVASSDSNIITGVIGSKVSKTFDIADGWRLTPEAGLALTYDLKRAKNKSNITLPNGSSYSIDGKNLSRFGVEIGGDVKAEFNDNIEMSLGYEGGFRKDYQNHSVLVNLKYNF